MFGVLARYTMNPRRLFLLLMALVLLPLEAVAGAAMGACAERMQAMETTAHMPHRADAPAHPHPCHADSLPSDGVTASQPDSPGCDDCAACHLFHCAGLPAHGATEPARFAGEMPEAGTSLLVSRTPDPLLEPPRR